MLVHSFSAMVSPIPTPIPVSLGILLWKTWGCGAARPPSPAFLQGTPFPFALPSLLVSLPLFHPSAECGTPHPPLDLSRRAALPRRYFPRRVSCHVRLYFLASSRVPEMFSTFDA